MKSIKTYWNNFQELIYGKSVIRFEDRLLLLSTLSLFAILAVSTIFNIVLNLKNSIIIVSFTGSLTFLGLYLYGRLVRIGNFIFLITSIIILVFTDAIWFVNYGSSGPIMPVFVVFFSFLILVFDRKYFLLISVIMFLNILGLYLYESRFHETIGSYPDLTTKLQDNYIGLVFSFLVIFSFMAAIKKNYIHEWERAKKSDLLKSAFVANMSHEIRTPLNAIAGFSSLMSDPDISDDDKKMFENQIQSNSDYLLSLIEDIIDVSKIESNQLTVNIQKVDIVPLVRQITQSFQLAIPTGKKVQILTNLTMSTLVVQVDPVRLEQILRNLLSNAVKFTEEGSIEVDCKKSKDFYTFSVIDTGIGIRAENQQMIFDRFMKIDNNLQHLHRGTGIGLFLSKQLVEIFGGKIWVESEPGKGSSFYFTIPV